MLRLSGVNRSFGKGESQVHALRDFCLEIPSGDYLAIMGPSGSGKSTLLNVMGLLDVMTDGDYEIDGFSVRGLPERELTRLRSERIGFVFQAFHLLGHKTAFENVMLGLVYAGVPRARRRPLAAQALDRVNMHHRARALPGTLSGGEKQRVAIARAMAASPTVLLCDEPTGNLDTQSASAVLQLLTELNGTGQTVVVVTHDEAVSSGCRRTVRVRDGRLESDTSVSESAVDTP
jgi:putative ABC transport system ATP-binding protein